MNNDMDRLAMEGNAEMLATMMSICRDKTLKKSHTSADLSADEKKQFGNCIMKFFESPNHILSSLNAAQGNQ